MTTTISIHNIVSVVATKRSSANGHTWRHITLTDSEGNEVKISLFPAAEDKPEQISIVDHELPEDKMSDKALAEASARDWKAICILKEGLPVPWRKFE